MTRVAVLGAGAGGAAAAVELTLRGAEVALWARSPQTLQPFAADGIAFEGVLGEGRIRPRLITAELGAALAGAEVVLVCLPTFAHREIAQALAAAEVAAPIVLNPGHTGGALEFRQVFREAGRSLPPIAELSTLTYVARKHRPGSVTVSGKAKRVRAANLPGGERALDAAVALFPAATPVADVLATGLANVNLVLHTPGAVLAAAWVEARAGDFTFYVEGMTPGVARVMQALDHERRAVARAFGHPLPSLVQEMQAIGTVEAGPLDPDDFATAIAAGEANRRIKAPQSLAHRYYREDFGHGLLPFLALAEIAGVDAPVAASLALIGETLLGRPLAAEGRTAERMGIAGLYREGLLKLVRG